MSDHNWKLVFRRVKHLLVGSHPVKNLQVELPSPAWAPSKLKVSPSPFSFFPLLFFSPYFFPFSLSLHPEEPSNCAKFTVTHKARITKCMVQRHWLLWLIISYNWPCSNIFAFPSEPAYQAALNAAPGEGAALGRTPRLSSAERGGAREGASGEREREKRDPRTETASSNDPQLRAGSSSSRTARRSFPLNKTVFCHMKSIMPFWGAP